MSTNNCEVRFSPEDSSALTKLNWLIDELEAANSRWTFFVNHPHDLIAVAGMHRSFSKRRVFVHHADHTFSLGLFVDVDKHIDFRQTGWENCRHHLGIKNNDLIGLTVSDQDCPPAANRFLKDGDLVTCTSGNNKFELPYSFQLEDCLPQWLKATGGRHIHIGHLSPATEIAVARKFEELNIDSNRLTIVPWVENLWEALLHHHVDFYIDSFPLCGCRALVEAMGAGVPVAVHQNYRHRLFRMQDLLTKAFLLWSKPEELEYRLQSIDREWLVSQSQEARTHYLNNHTPNNLKNNLEDVLNLETLKNVEHCNHYILDPLRAFFDGFVGQSQLRQSSKKDKMLQLLSLAKAIDLPAELFEQTLESQSTPQDFIRYKRFYKRLGNQVRVMNLIEEYYPVTTEDELNKEKLSRVLFAISQLNSAQETSGIAKNAKFILRYHNIVRRLAKIARSAVNV